MTDLYDDSSNEEEDEEDDDEMYEYFSSSPLVPFDIPLPNSYDPEIESIITNTKPNFMNNYQLKTKESEKSEEFQDFIILSEFCEQQGPVVYGVYPIWTRTPVNINEFVVQIMSTDYQLELEVGVITKDSEFVINLSEQKIFAYVHHFPLFELNARGYTRQICFSYLTSNRKKLMSNFQQISKSFSKIISILKSGNRCFFFQELEIRTLNLEYTLAYIIKQMNENYQKNKNKENTIQIKDKFGVKLSNAITPEFVKELLLETRSIHERIRKTLKKNEYLYLHNYFGQPIEKLNKIIQKNQVEEKLYLNTKSNNDGNEININKNDQNNKKKDFNMSDYQKIIDNSNIYLYYKNYEPKLLNKIHKPFTIDQKLRSIEIICSEKVYHDSEIKIRKFYENFRKNSIQNTLETQYSIPLIPKETCLKIGNKSLINVFPSMQLGTKKIKNQKIKITTKEEEKLDKDFDDGDSDTYSFDDDNEDEDEDGEDEDEDEISIDFLNEEKEKKNRKILNPFKNGFSSPNYGFYQLLWKNNQYYHSGKDILLFLKRFDWCLEKFIYCLLVGKPILIYAKPINEQIIKLIINAFSLFIPGEINEQAVNFWMEDVETQQLSITRITNLKLGGISKKIFIPESLKKFCIILDYEQKTFNYTTKNFSGKSFVDKLISTKNRFEEETLYIAHVYKVFTHISLILYIYFHAEISENKFDLTSFMEFWDLTNQDIEIIQYLSLLLKKQIIQNSLLKNSHRMAQFITLNN
ncbi:hypothetical protein M0812_19845 [Anaeramoeba flamelloides]|uniref:UDENN FLCN/SMCR8-type domain-containing protein n=1 Tax=Anaeramoeba flamelloides TaxID=1746091 RepID=A0AAV7Z428_9EUKA|nr:hypothetical protein M0812_19845 [Anaeramoeba flamelloides]